MLNNLWCTNYSSVQTNTRFTVHTNVGAKMIHLVRILVSKLKIEKIDKFQKMLFLGLKSAFFTQNFLLLGGGGALNDKIGEGL